MKNNGASAFEINQLKVNNYLASGTCPKTPQPTGCQSGRLGEIVAIKVFLQWLSRKYMVSISVILMIKKCLEKQESTREI